MIACAHIYYSDLDVCSQLNKLNIDRRSLHYTINCWTWNRNSKLETRNSEQGTRNKKQETRNKKQEIRNKKQDTDERSILNFNPSETAQLRLAFFAVTAKALSWTRAQGLRCGVEMRLVWCVEEELLGKMGKGKRGAVLDVMRCLVWGYLIAIVGMDIGCWAAISNMAFAWNWSYTVLARVEISWLFRMWCRLDALVWIGFVRSPWIVLA